MENKLIVLFIGRDIEAASDLTKVYGSDFCFEECDFTNKLHKAIQSVRDIAYNLCFISDQYSMAETRSFFADYEKLDKDQVCVFVQVRDQLEKDFDRTSLSAAGFTTIISRIGTHADKETLRETLKTLLFQDAIREKKITVEVALDIVLRDLDKVARERKRGRDCKLDKLAVDFIALQTEFNEEVLQKYFNQLAEKTGEAEPQNQHEVKIPTQVLQRQLPNLKSNTYTGASSRVWAKLLKRYGLEEGDITAAPAAVQHSTEEPTSEDDPEDIIEGDGTSPEE
ncbi:hypothetical protein OAO01_05625 [Oligoflexia bacterium]|nr:hypothetical protein [Oligoflexia bacterium]